MFDKLVAIDTNIAIFFCDALDGNYDPALDKNQLISLERLAIFRIFIYTECLILTPTALSEIKEPKQKHSCLVLLPEITERSIDNSRLKALTSEYLNFYKHSNDCRILAEAVIGGCEYLLSYEVGLIKNFKDKTNIKIMWPSEFWNILNLPKGSKAVLQPSWPNPKVTQDWYKW